MTKKEAEVKTMPKAKPTDESVLGVNSFAMPDVAMSGAVDDSWCESESQVKWENIDLFPLHYFSDMVWSCGYVGSAYLT